MKKAIYSIFALIILTGLMILYVHKNYPDNIMEICMSEYYSPKIIRDLIDKTGVYDYANVYDLFSAEGNAKVYTGNINILISRRIKDKLNIGLNSKEVLVGDRFAKKSYSYYPLGEKHITTFGEYTINAIISDCDEVYYNDLTILQRETVKNQRLYIVLKDKNNIAVDENTFISYLTSGGIITSAAVSYGNVKKLLTKFFILLLMILIIYAAVKLYNSLKSTVAKLIKMYSKFKYDLYFREFILKTDNLSDIKNIFICIIALFLLISVIRFLTVEYINLKMPYRLNPVSPKSIYAVISLYIGLMSYYIRNGMTEISTLIFSLSVIYFIAAVLTGMRAIVGCTSITQLSQCLKRLNYIILKE